MNQFNGLVWSVVRSFRLNEADALDASQMTWLRAVENLDRVEDPERLGLWLSTIARRESLRIIEKSNRTVLLADENDWVVEASERSVENKVILEEECRRVLDALAKMGPACRSLLRLLLSDPPCSYEIVSASLEIAVGTIGPRRARCLQKLRSLAGS